MQHIICKKTALKPLTLLEKGVQKLMRQAPVAPKTKKCTSASKKPRFTLGKVKRNFCAETDDAPNKA